VLPSVLTVVFAALFVSYRSRGGYRPVSLEAEPHLVEGAR